jgi:hypothetical protein
MTIELSLRRRASRARYMAILWLSIATLLLVFTYLTLPFVTQQIVSSIGGSGVGSSGLKDVVENEKKEVKAGPGLQIYTVVIVGLGTGAILFACFLMGRAAFVEIELGARFSGFADALCISGNNFEQLEKAANILMPEAKYLSVPEIFSAKDMQSLVEVLKQLKVS